MRDNAPYYASLILLLLNYLKYVGDIETMNIKWFLKYSYGLMRKHALKIGIVSVIVWIVLLLISFYYALL